MNNKTVNNVFDSAISSIHTDGSYAIAATIATKMKTRMVEYNNMIGKAIEANDNESVKVLTKQMVNSMATDLASLMTALERVDDATIQLLNSLKPIFSKALEVRAQN